MYLTFSRITEYYVLFQPQMTRKISGDKESKLSDQVGIVASHEKVPFNENNTNESFYKNNTY